MSGIKKVTVDVISDVACPWCWVGKRAIETAAMNINASAPNSLELELRWHPFQLSPDIPQDTTTNLLDHLARVVGSRDTVNRWVTHPDEIPMNQGCKASNLSNIYFRMSPDAVGFNTYRAHMLLTYTGKVLGDYKKQSALKEAMLRKTHGEGKNLDRADELLEAAKEAGVVLSAEELNRLLCDSAIKKTLNEELDAAQRVPSFNGVPYFTFPDGRHFSGGRPVEDFEKALKENM